MSADRLLADWLGCAAPDPEGLNPNGTAKTLVPMFEGDEVYMAEAYFGANHELAAAKQMEIFHARKLVSTLRLDLTREDPTPVEECLSEYPDYSAEMASKVRVTNGEMDFRYVWPAPFGGMMPAYSNTEDQQAWAAAHHVCEVAQSDPSSARAALSSAALDWVSDGISTLQRAWFEPILAREGERSALIAAEARFGLPPVMVLGDVDAKSEWKDALRRPVAVRRAWGVPGLMFTLLQVRLDEGTELRFCERCGTLLGGRSNRRFCGEDDNPGCRRAYDRERKRRQRQYRGEVE